MISQNAEKYRKEVVKMSKIKITQLKSAIGRKNNQREILISLGLNKINRERILENNPSITGMIKKVKHLIKVEQVK